MSDHVVSCEGVRKSYVTESEELEILRGVDFTLAPGDRASITGRSGCGKSTFLSILGGLDRADSGSVVVGGTPLHRLPERSLSAFRSGVVGFIFQFHYLLKDFTALENAMLPAYMSGTGKPEAIGKARALLESMDLGDRLDHTPARLSGGERQRVAIARALVNSPRVLLADEPTGNLDEASSRSVEDLLFEMAERTGTTLILVTHDQRLARRAERRFLLHEGVLVES